jgi:nucleobase transporter 1/2
MVIVWLLCYVLTETNVLSPTNLARTDLKTGTVTKSDWFVFPYPCKQRCFTLLINISLRKPKIQSYTLNKIFKRQNPSLFLVQWGLPTVTIGSVLGMLCAVLTGTVESIGDYYAASEIVGRFLRKHPINPTTIKAAPQ